MKYLTGDEFICIISYLLLVFIAMAWCFYFRYSDDYVQSNIFEYKDFFKLKKKHEDKYTR